MATDTAFALGILSCFKSKLPKGIFTFLAAVAIIDDIGASIVIAIFYTAQLNLWMLFVAFLLVLLLILLNYSGFRKPWVYIFVGVTLWAAIEAAGIQGTISGILAAFIIPARPERGPVAAIKHARRLLSRFEDRKNETALILEDQKQHDALEEIQKVALEATTPLQQWKSNLKLPVALFILPLFALVNAGIPINTHLLANVFTHRVSLGIFIGLVVGKPLGVVLFSKVALYCKVGIMPADTKFNQIVSASLLTGIGFTMALFIANLSITNDSTLLIAKAAILLGSVATSLFTLFKL